MSSPVEVRCPGCRAPVAPDSSFCTRCGATLAVREIAAVVGADQRWGGDPGRASGRPAGPSAGDPGTGPARGRGEATADGPWAAGTAVPSHHVALGPAFDGTTPASTSRRVLAYLLDTVVVALVAALVLLVTRSGLLAALAALEVAAGLVLWEARTGRTVGNTVLGLRTAQEDVPWAPGLGRALGRAGVVAAGHLVVVGQWLVVASVAFDRSGRRQGWHDRLAGTVVVDVRGLSRDDDAPAPYRAPVVDLGAAESSTAAVATPSEPVVVPEPAPVSPVAPGGASAEPVVLPEPASVERVTPAVQSASAEPVVPQSALSEPASAEPAAPVAEPVASTYVVVLDDGRAMSVSGPGYVGRRPQPVAGERCDHVIQIDDPGRSLSRSHARFGIDAAGFWVEDNDSANGTAVVHRDGTVLEAVPGQRVPVPPGATVRLGDRTFTVEPYA